MIRICRAEDGEVFQSAATIEDIVGSASLETFLRTEIGIDESAVQAYLSDGRRLRTENLRDLDDVQDQTIFVFNKYYIRKDIDEVVKLFHLQPTLQLPIHESTIMTPSLGPTALAASHRRVISEHQEAISRILDSMRHQQSALGVASTGLARRVLDVINIFDDVAASTRQELDKQASLISSVGNDIELASHVQIHRDFLSPAALRATSAGGPARTLGYYVSSESMHQVVEACQRTHDDLKERFRCVDEKKRRLTDGAARVRAVVSENKLLDEAASLDQVSRRMQDSSSEAVRATDAPVPRVEARVQGRIYSSLQPFSLKSLEELSQLDISIRENLSSITELKNAFTEKSLRALSQINTLNDDLTTLGTDLADLQVDLGVENNMFELKRLHGMVEAYGTTVIEIVRRKEFSRFFYRKCHSISETMVNLLAAERNRRQAFRGEVHGRLPFDLIGMHDTVPSLNLSLSGGRDTDSPYSLERSDIKNLLSALEGLEQSRNDDDMALVNTRGVHARLEGLVREVDCLESEFDRSVGISLTSSSQLALHERQAERGIKEPIKNSLDPEKTTANRESLLEEEGRALRAEVAHLKEQVRHTSRENERAERLERDLNRAYEQIENEVTRRVSIEDRYDSLLSTVQGLRGEVDNVFAGLIGEKISPVGRGDHIPGQGRSRVGMEHTELQAWAEGHQHRMKEGTNPAVMEQAVGGSAREAQSRLEDKVEEANRIIAQLLEIANTYRTTYHEASKLARDAVSLHSKHHKGPGEPHATPKHDEHAPDEPSPYIDPSDPTGAIGTLRAFDHDEFLEEIKKTGSTIRKWQKQCKEYRERGKTKISFRNFTEGDLALFLPTRNKLSKPWAAFNVSFPHYFLEATGQLVESLKRREWLIGRITSMTERVVDPNIPDSNPYGLDDGVKYYLLEIEHWCRPTTNAAAGPSTPAETSGVPGSG